jgi:hypothetical protein
VVRLWFSLESELVQLREALAYSDEHIYRGLVEIVWHLHK